MTDTPPRRLRASLTGLVAALIGVGCVVPSLPDGTDAQPPPRAPQSQDPQAGTTGPANTTLDGTDTPEEFRQDVADAQRLTERYWEEQFRAAGRRFQPVSRVITYQRDGEVTCGGQAVPAANAVYCPAGDYIAYDENWSFGAFRQIGDAFVFYLMGHEYAHAVQVRLGLRHTFTIQQELQADCMAGASLGDTVRAGRLLLEKGDLDEFRAGLLAVGDDPDQPWFEQGAHGTPEQRIGSFFRGYERSLSACELGG
ncbi:neutral zinc metallopeptidase [Micromonospora sp. SH-82]|uniref:neutral zinc metallopeptidase n=1 Tax=Micromonospora sp. SH-82 TaxID=3132938 RepID=UPI003EC0DE6F